MSASVIPQGRHFDHFDCRCPDVHPQGFGGRDDLGQRSTQVFIRAVDLWCRLSKEKLHPVQKWPGRFRQAKLGKSCSVNQGGGAAEEQIKAFAKIVEIGLRLDNRQPCRLFKPHGIQFQLRDVPLKVVGRFFFQRPQLIAQADVIERHKGNGDHDEDRQNPPEPPGQTGEGNRARLGLGPGALAEHVSPSLRSGQVARSSGRNILRFDIRRHRQRDRSTRSAPCRAAKGSFHQPDRPEAGRHPRRPQSAW